MPSATALAVALARGLASLGDAPAPDPVARELLPRGLGALLRGLDPIAARVPLEPALRVASAGLIGHVALRTAAIDAALVEAIRCGVDQVVILGAGLDARAYRLDALRDATVLEVDHPATQRFKRGRVEGLLPMARDVRFIAVDFERDDLGARLAEEGHDASRPTFWLWEGVVMYLEEPAIRGSLRAMHARSAPGSRLGVTYGLNEDGLWLRRFSRAVLAGFRVLGEPLIGLTTTVAFHALLGDEGWRVLGDEGPKEWRARYRHGVGGPFAVEERLAVAERA